MDEGVRPKTEESECQRVIPARSLHSSFFLLRSSFFLPHSSSSFLVAVASIKTVHSPSAPCIADVTIIVLSSLNS